MGATRVSRQRIQLLGGVCFNKFELLLKEREFNSVDLNCSPKNMIGHVLFIFILLFLGVLDIVSDLLFHCSIYFRQFFLWNKIFNSVEGQLTIQRVNASKEEHSCKKLVSRNCQHFLFFWGIGRNLIRCNEI